MTNALRRLPALVAGALSLACVSLPGTDHSISRRAHVHQQSNTGPRSDPALARVRAATARYRVLDSAVAAGYAGSADVCVAHRRDGGMGYHHPNASLLDDRLEPERPEILTYERTPGGRYALTGVEYVVPYHAWPRTRPAPRILGQALKPSDELQIWYLHVWLWKENPSGIFADWNPSITCPKG